VSNSAKPWSPTLGVSKTVWTDCVARSLLEWLAELRPRTCSDDQQYWLGDSGSIWVFDRLRVLLSRWTYYAWPGPMSLRAAASAARSEVPRTGVAAMR